MRPDPFAGIGPLLHQEANDVRTPPQHRMVQRPMLIVFRDIQVHELRASRDHRPHGVEVAVTHREDEPPDRDAIDKGLQLRPAVESVGARQDELRVVQREACGIGVPVVREHFLGRAGASFAKRVEQLPGLASELIEMRTIGEAYGWGQGVGSR